MGGNLKKTHGVNNHPLKRGQLQGLWSWYDTYVASCGLLPRDWKNTNVPRHPTLLPFPNVEGENFPKWYRKLVLEIHLLEFNILPEKWWLEDKPFLLGPAHFVKLWAGTL